MSDSIIVHVGQPVTLASSTAYAASLIAKASGGIFFGFTGYNSGADQWIQVHNSASLPANTSVPVFTVFAPSNDNFSFDVGQFPVNFSTGIVICNSSTAPTKTIGSANCWFNVTYL